MRITRLRRFDVSSVVVLSTILLLWIALPSIAYELTGSWQRAAEIGEAFGGASSFFTGLALIGVTLSLKVQRDDIVKRDARIRLEQNAAADQIVQLSLTTQLQITSTQNR
jgi:hypothetical protein